MSALASIAAAPTSAPERRVLARVHLGDVPDATDFGAVLRAADAPAATDRTTTPDDDALAARRAELRTLGEQLVASAFVTPVLKQVREAPMAEGPFAPNRAMKAFGALLDERLSDEIVSGAGWSLVDAVVDAIAPEPDAPAGPRLKELRA